MAGIYIHIPFCKSKCTYCDFYSTNNLELIKLYIERLLDEIEYRKTYLEDKSVHSVYFGGGTPSVLHVRDVELILASIYENFKIDKNAEISFEANPDDLDRDYLSSLKKTGINRLSIGIQSIHDKELRLMKRRHKAEKALQSIDWAAEVFDNISVDLIYGLPDSTLETWKESLIALVVKPVNHLSAYHLTYEPQTPIYKKLIQNEIAEIGEGLSLAQFDLLCETSEKFGFEHYEISNFARKKMYSKHNLSYWNNTPYIGLGAAAHSYNITSREWNPCDLKLYLNNEKNIFPKEMEILTTKQKFNEYIMTGLRTSKGCRLDYIKQNFGNAIYALTLRKVNRFIEQKKIKQKGNDFTLTKKALFISDAIIADLFLES